MAKTLIQKLANKRYYRTPKGKAAKRNQNLKRQYGITEAEYNGMLALQGGVCAICKCSETLTICDVLVSLAVDHDHRCCPENKHSCGKCIRGLLCSNCNTALAKLKDNPGLARAMADYLEQR
jgi:Recombination endonuclease VII